MKPTEHEIKAVHKALYKTERLQELVVLQRNIAVLMNFNPNTPLPSKDDRNPAGSGPQWFDTHTGAVASSVREAADDCDKIAAALMAMHDDVGKVSFPSDDKQHLQAALAAEAASWTARGQIWRAPSKPDVHAATESIEVHVRKAISEGRQVQPYLKTKHEVHSGE